MADMGTAALGLGSVSASDAVIIDLLARPAHCLTEQIVS
jgi:hypothetical protein